MTAADYQAVAESVGALAALIGIGGSWGGRKDCRRP